MHLQLTVVVSGAPPSDQRPAMVPTEVEVEAPQGADTGQLAVALATALADPTYADEATIWVAGTRVEGGAPVGRHPVMDGAALTLLLRSGRSPVAHPAPARTPVAVAVAHGPDAGRTLELLARVHTLGRGEDTAITVDDPRISRLHAVIAVTADSVTVADAGSTNGTYLDGVPVGAQPKPAQLGATIGIGDSLLVVRPRSGLPASVSAGGEGTLAVNRRPRLLGTPVPQSISLPSPPAATLAPRVPWLAMLLPLPVAGVLALFFGPTMLAFAVMSPLLMAGTVVGDRFTGKRRYAAEHAAYLRRLRRARAEVDNALREEAEHLRSTLPDPAEILAIATTPTAQVWERRRADPDVLTVSLGWCTMPASVRVVGGNDADLEHPLLQGVPCKISLDDVGVTGFCGNRDTVLRVLRGALGQLVTLHSPLDLELVLVSGLDSVDEDWSWLGRLPHVRGSDGRPRDGWLLTLDRTGSAGAGVAALASVVRQRVADLDGRARAWSGPRTLLVLDGAAKLRALPDLAEVLEHGPSVGICVVAVDADRPGLPSEAGAVLDLTDPATPLLQLPDAAPAHLVVDQVGTWWADRLSRGLAPLRDATPGAQASAPPASVGLGELLGLEEAGSMSATIARGWSTAPRTTSVPIGRSADGPFRVDLASDGPHVLVAGTTGAGKSELLRTLVAALAVHNRPEHLSMVLVDYKGGAAFRDCEPLPHVAAVVTDLDEHLASRAHTSLRAELKRRERMLAEAGATDFLAYQSSPAADGAPLPRLVIVVDEFRALAEELPEFVQGMVAVAALGRSLGMHLVLATQRPSGVVTADIKANLNLRIGLRLRDRADSLDVLDCADAAGLDPTTPGRALARVGSAAVIALQAAHAGAPSGRRQPAGIRVRVLPWGQAPHAWPGTPEDQDTTTDLSVVVAAVSAAADLTGAQRATSPWLPALAGRIDAESLPTARVPSRFPIGLVDEPALQRQTPLEVALDEPGHWAFVGGPGSGRTTALLAVVRATTSAVGASDLHLYAVSGGSLAAVESLPHCGAHVGIDDLPRLERLVARLSEELSHRRTRLATAGQPSVVHVRRAEPATAPAAVVLLVDDWDLLAQRADENPGSEVVPKLLGLLREGAGLGLTAVLAGDRALLIGRAASLMTHRVVLRMDDPTDLLLAGFPPRSTPADQPPGRGLSRDGAEVQIAVPGSFADGPMRCASEAVNQSPARRRPWRVDALPQRVEGSSLPAPTSGDDTVMVGLGGDELGARGLSPGRDGRQWAVLGGQASGVSTALATIASGLLSHGRIICVIGSGSAAWEGLSRDPRVVWCDDSGRVDELVALQRRVPGLAVLVDDADRLLDTPLDTALREVAGLVDRDRGLVVVGAKADAVSVQYRGLAVAVAQHRTGVLLGPSSSTAAELFGIRVPVDRAAGPGRGYLVSAGVTLPIQVATYRRGRLAAMRFDL